jgi:hypothetical protein
MSGLLRSLFFVSQPGRYRKAGFVLPTTVLLLLMVTLTVGAMSFRTFSRTEQSIAIRNQQIVDEIAAPAIDRAKAKIEFLFTEDASIADKRPPSSSDLLTALHEPASGIEDVYTFPGEGRVDIDGDSANDDAWKFSLDDGTEVIYSIVLDDFIDPDGSPDNDDEITISESTDVVKAQNKVVRNGPLDTTTPTGSCPVERLAGNGWQLAGGKLAKNIQVNVLTVKDKGKPSETVSASEYQQVRTATRGNKWGAWFRYDMVVTPGESFRWNGAMHSEGGMLANSGFVAYMVSSEGSCIYDDTASSIEVKGNEDHPFLGQLISGNVFENEFEDGAYFHAAGTADEAGNAGYTDEGYQLTTSVDMIKNGATSIADILQDPVKIFTEDEFVHVEAPSNTTWERDTDKWDPDTNKFGIGRVRNDVSGAARPFLDDGYRADNRYGPKPSYNKENTLIGAGKFSGDDIVANTTLTNNVASNAELGLDGYWERSAVAQGLRIIVGQRLELGNTFGWKGNKDPLYPPNGDFDVMRNSDGTALKGVNEALQMRSLRDNLAAVQSMAVYHYTHDNGQSPLACVASTAHPGSFETIKQSRTFDKYQHLPSPIASTTRQWETDFFTGKGTNGIAFTPPSITTTTHGALPSDWQKALKNLAYFAGDPLGGAPSFPAKQVQAGSAGAFVHPYPYLSMWGDFSILRRIFEYDSTYELSPADQSTIHTAACTLGMLAYNIKAVEDELNNIPAAELTALALSLDSISGGTTTDDWISRLYDSVQGDIDGFTVADAKMLKNALIVAEHFQIERDRTFGFIPASAAQGLPPSSAPYDASARTYNGSAVGCDPGLFDSLVLEAQRVTLARTLCSTAQGPKYPALYYLFPVTDHDQSGDSSGGFNHQQPTGSEDLFSVGGTEYINDSNVNNDGTNIYETFDVSSIALASPSVPGTLIPTELVDTTAASDYKPNFDSFNAPDAAPAGSYAYSTAGLAEAATEEEKNLSSNVIAVQEGINYGFYKTAFLDTAMMNGRELLVSRLMNLDIDLLTKNTVDGTSYWIPSDSGIVYAFREDAVREDAIVRPYSSALNSDAAIAWSQCDTISELAATPNCKMSLNPTGTPHDPPLNTNTRISPKPVDMYADPDRRAHGFRFINGKSLHRENTSSPTQPAPVGMTFITDNAAYIKGDFNLHAVKPANFNTEVDESNLIEEFMGNNAEGNSNVLGTAFATETEANARKLFYGRTADKLDPKFADENEDNWRPVEIFSDAITILSDTFLDGSAKDYFTVTQKDNDGQPRKNSSYLNANRPRIGNGSTKVARHASRAWFHEIDASVDEISPLIYPYDRDETPIVVGRNGLIYKSNITKGTNVVVPFVRYPKEIVSTDGNISFYAKVSGKNLADIKVTQIPSPRRSDAGGGDPEPDEAPVRVNALLISGIVPARAGQGYGGLHNFPRLLEHWSERSNGGVSEKNRFLVISGGFFQLNFSSQATGPFDQDAWEPESSPTLGKDGPIPGGSGNARQSIFYYKPPQRVWGYDPALQYSPAGPIAQRFVRVDRPRSEYYRELPVSDPYIQNLCSQLTGGCS